jgi:hypothetical protein
MLLRLAAQVIAWWVATLTFGHIFFHFINYSLAPVVRAS